MIKPTPIISNTAPTLKKRFAPGQCIILKRAPKIILANEIKDKIIPNTKSVFINLFYYLHTPPPLKRGIQTH